MVSHKKKVINNSTMLLIFVIFLVGYLIFKNFVSSVYLKKTDRLNIVFYDRFPTYYSLGFSDVDYMVPFSSNMQVLVPGGYGNYRVGGLDKLVSLEKKPILFPRTFSSNVSSLVDLYFYPQKTMIYYEDTSAQRHLPSWREIFLYKTNADTLDKIFIWLYFARKSISQYKTIDDMPVKIVDSDNLFDREEFFKKYLGHFYRETYRKEKLHVQILYTKSYKTAEIISNILDGEGIQVVDLATSDTAVGSRCQITYSKDSYKDTRTVKDLGSYFGCNVKKGQTDVSDITLTLGNIENEWIIR